MWSALEDNTPVTSRFGKKVLDFKCFSPFFCAKDGLPWWSKMQRKWEKRAACNFWTLCLTVPNSPITYNLSNFITGCRSLGDKIIEVLLYHPHKTKTFMRPILNPIGKRDFQYYSTPSVYPNTHKYTNTQIHICHCLVQGNALLQGPCLYTDKGYNISVLIYKGCWIGLCVGVQKKCYDQWNCWIWYSELVFLSYLQWTNI